MKGKEPYSEVCVSHLLGQPVDLSLGVAEDDSLGDGQGVVTTAKILERHLLYKIDHNVQIGQSLESDREIVLYVSDSVDRSQSIATHLNSSFSTATKNCLIPSNVNSSRLTKILMGSVMNLVVISSTSWGKVADKMTT